MRELLEELRARASRNSAAPELVTSPLQLSNIFNTILKGEMK
jgi:hypothetical protein